MRGREGITQASLTTPVMTLNNHAMLSASQTSAHLRLVPKFKHCGCRIIIAREVLKHCRTRVALSSPALHRASSCNANGNLASVSAAPPTSSNSDCATDRK